MLTCRVGPCRGAAFAPGLGRRLTCADQARQRGKRISRRRVADGRGVLAAHRPRGSHAFRCVSGYGVRRVARDGPLQQACLPNPSDLASTLSAQAWVTGRAGGANNRRRREGDRGQNAEPTSSARTKPGPSAHGSEQQMSATRFAAPSAGAPNAAAALGWLFFVCGTDAHGRPRRWFAEQPCFAGRWSQKGISAYRKDAATAAAAARRPGAPILRSCAG